MGYFICLYVRRRRANLWGSLDTVLFRVYRLAGVFQRERRETRGYEISLGREDKRRSGPRVRGARSFILSWREDTSGETRARKLSVCLLETHALLTPHVLRPATLSYIFVVRAPISLRSGTYEIRRPICRSFTCQNVLSYWRCICDGCYVAFIPIPRSLPLPPRPPSYALCSVDVVEGLSRERMYLTRVESFLAYLHLFAKFSLHEGHR